MNQQILLIIS